MSDPVTNVEIEDVLSSIRRLVSSDGRRAEAPATSGDGAAASAPPSPEADRLVLTPSLRVDSAAPKPAAPLQSPQGEGGSEPSAEASVQETRADEAAETDEERGEEPELSAPVSTADAGDDWTDQIDPPEQDTADMQGQAPDDAPDEMSELDDMIEEADDASLADHVDHADPQAPKGADLLKLRVAELEEVVSRQPEQWEADGPGQDGNSGDTVSPLPWEDYVPETDGGGARDAESLRAGDETADHVIAQDEADIEEAAAEDDWGDAAQDASEPVEDDAAPALRLGEALRRPGLAAAHAETAHAGGAEPTGARGGADDTQARPAPEDREISGDVDAEEPLSSGAPGSAARTSENEATDFLAGNDEFLDEDALRDLVADIVRQELQGALGERITRNVRKLVRREIHRALTSQDFQ